jgi:1-phosphofructokinase family hexose kinase
MIATVTLNPLLERRLEYERVVLGETHRPLGETYAAGGKGINVSRQLRKLGVDSLAFTVLGGANGKRMRRLLKDEGIEFVAVASKSDSRSAALAIDRSAPSVTAFFGPDADPTDEDADELIDRLRKALNTCDILVLSGSSPNETTDRVFPTIIEEANLEGKTTVLDTYGRHLSACLDAEPTATHNNVQELAASLGLPLDSETDKRRALDELTRRGVKRVLLTDGARSAYVSNFGYHYKLTPPEVAEVDPVGSGDAFVAGVVYGWTSELVFIDETLPIAAALGAANARRLDACAVEREEWEPLVEAARVETVGKKMKQVDVTPRR